MLWVLAMLIGCHSGGAVRVPDGADDSAADDSGGDDTGQATPLRVAVLSDLNGSYGATTYGAPVHAAVAALLADPPDLVLSTGDMVAGQQSGLDHQAMWDGFHAAVSDPLAAASIPFAVTPGNHDASGYSGYTAERALFVAEWNARVPDVSFVDDTDYPLRYAFVAGDALFVSLDDTTVGALAAEQRQWLDDVLDEPAAVKVVFGHVPLVPFAAGRETDVLGDAALEQLLVAHGVTVFLSGHHHAYYPGRRGPLRLVSTACLGAGPRALVGTTETSPRSVVRFTVGDGALTDLDAWTGEAYDEVVLRQVLPDHLGEGSDRVDRDDL